MSLESGARVAPLRYDDPERLGEYELTGRLGQGGMGTVYLARDGRGRPVAVKVIRADLAADPEFRQRFRSEVNRARQVPPFCTAEVLDADPDHRFPYLVVEYVDGPSLADVVEEEGPLSSGHLHALAIGVATALTAIHGAGVVHRDLKPRNVLLAPVSPKVIDFGIARAMEATSHLTRTSQMLGTVAYMAPERFDTESAQPLGPAADIFAWGAVMAYAGTGRSPFHADSPPATAARILTQPPDLNGLPSQLRGLVEITLAKDPDERPDARELLDLLLGSGPQAASARAVLAEQPGLQDAARHARAGRHAVQRPGSAGAPRQRRRSQWKTITAAAVSVVLVAGAAAYLLRPGEPVSSAGTAPSAAAGPSAVAGPAAVASPSAVPEPSAAGGLSPVTSPSVDAAPGPGTVAIRDDLAKAALWQSTEAEGAACVFNKDGGYRVRLTVPGYFLCTGPTQKVTGDQVVAVDVTLDRPGSCASLYFLRTNEDDYYELEICRTAVVLNRHDAANVEPIGSITLPDEIPLGRRTQITARLVGGTATVQLNNRTIAEMGIPAGALRAGGEITLGMFGVPDSRPPFQVTYHRIEVRSLR